MLAKNSLVVFLTTQLLTAATFAAKIDGASIFYSLVRYDGSASCASTPILIGAVELNSCTRVSLGGANSA